MALRRGCVLKPSVVELRYNNQSVCVDKYSRMCSCQVFMFAGMTKIVHASKLKTNSGPK